MFDKDLITTFSSFDQTFVFLWKTCRNLLGTLVQKIGAFCSSKVKVFQLGWKLSFKKKCFKSVFDFPTLHTDIPHYKLFCVLYSLFYFCFDRLEKRTLTWANCINYPWSILIPKSTLFWRTSAKGCFWQCLWNWLKLKIVDTRF